MIEKITYAELVKKLRGHEMDHPKEHLTANIVFRADSFSEPYSLAARTYLISSDNKAYQPNMGGYSIIGTCADGTDSMVRLEKYMAAEQGGKDGWQVEYCYITRCVDRKSKHIRVDGHTGTWRVIDAEVFIAEKARHSVCCFLLVSEQDGENAARLIVSEYGVPLLDGVYHGFDDLIEAGWTKCSEKRKDK